MSVQPLLGSVSMSILAGLGGGGSAATQYLDPLQSPPHYTLTDNNILVTTGPVSNAFVPAAFPCAGRAYFEVELVDAGADGEIGIAYANNVDHFPSGGDPMHYPNGITWQAADNLIANGTSHGGIGSGAWVTGDILMCAFNHTTGRIYFGRNGVWDVDPTNPDLSTWSVTIKGGEYYFCAGPHTVGSSWNVRFEAADMTYPAPVGYLPGRTAFEAVNGTVAGVGTDPYWDDVVFLAGWDGVDGSQPVTDDGPGAVPLTYVGALCSVDTTQTPAGGDSTGSLYVESGDYVTFPGANVGILPGDFTIECHARFDTFGGWDGLFGDFRSNDEGSWGFLRDGSSNELRFAVVYTTLDFTGTGALAISTDYHLAVSRSGLTTRMFVNGALVGSLTEIYPCSINARNVTNFVGRNDFGDPMQGWIDEMRITKAARYTAAFTPGTGKFPRG